MDCGLGSELGDIGAHGKSYIMVITIIALLFCNTVVVRAQQFALDTSAATMMAQSEKRTSGLPNSKSAPGVSNNPGRGAIVVVPIPTSSPAIGNGATILGGYIFPLRKTDKISPPSIIGGTWVGTDNGTRAWAVGTELYFNQDRYHAISGVAHGDLNYDFYGTGTVNGDAGRKFGLNQTGNVFFGEILRRTFWEIFVGPRLWIGKSRLEPQHLGETFPDLPPLGVDFSMNSLGFKIERETTPNRFYPEKGTLFQLGSDFFSKDIGGTFTFQRYRLTFNAYHTAAKRQVLAYNAFACATGGNAPFFGQCIFGLQNELRGYPAGRYIDKDMLATQAEYRLSLPWRLGLAAFAGLGEVAPSFSKFDAGNILPSGGVGPRFVLSSKYHVNLRADFAWGKNGRTFSMGLGESF